MKMMCIKDGPWIWIDTGEILKGPAYGDHVQKIGDKGNYYILEGYPSNNGYHKKWFILLSDRDETEMVREKQLVEA